ncbi:exported hypothetical protein [Alphaproteobacteria bacterium]
MTNFYKNTLSTLKVLFLLTAVQFCLPHLCSITCASADDDRENITEKEGKDTCNIEIATYIERFDIKENDKNYNGHTVAKHINKDKEWLIENLQNNSKMKAMSSYDDANVANSTVKSIMHSNTKKISDWLLNKTTKSLQLKQDMKQKIGYKFMQNNKKLIECNSAIVVLKRYGNKCFYVLTSYPME